MTLRGIEVHDDENDSWTEMHSHSLPGVKVSRKHDIRPLFPVLAINGELLTVSYWPDSVTGELELSLLQSKGFGSKHKELVWEKPHPNADVPYNSQTEAFLAFCPVVL